MVFRTLAHKTSLHQTQKPSTAPRVSNAVFIPEGNGGCDVYFRVTHHPVHPPIHNVAPYSGGSPGALNDEAGRRSKGWGVRRNGVMPAKLDEVAEST